MVYQYILVRSNSRLYVIDVLYNPDSGKDLTDDYIAGCLTRCADIIALIDKYTQLFVLV